MLTLDLIFNVVLLAGAIYCFFFIGSVDNATSTELGAAFWPRLILGIMIVLLAVGLVNTIRKKNGKGPVTGEAIAGFFRSKLLVGIIICAAAALILPQIGFIPTCFLFLIAYGILLGEKRPVVLLITGVVATLVLYIIFQGPLSIFLPRGNGFFRNFALFMENILGMIPGL
ncbi:tripartite tricarboxylate transporter TctB family protein [Colidextribacter sp. OB.20]|uniref:tripartite tricarboxylate transporter TctB family protein n=1 Tax=Colidextribacter sp. OB.20 TaxID=2304568 RepID=UPI001FAD110F|nr:tripartite tricarboxylate transporter TctB family protein [Colidextribacter sp. OB.20]